MIDPTEGAMQLIVQRCHAAGETLTAKQQAAIASVIADVLAEYQQQALAAAKYTPLDFQNLLDAGWNAYAAILLVESIVDDENVTMPISFSVGKIRDGKTVRVGITIVPVCDSEGNR